MKIWIAGRSHTNAKWEVLGVCDSEKRALNKCLHNNDFVAPLYLNESFPDEITDWNGLYYTNGEDVSYLITSMHSVYPMIRYHMFERHRKTWTLGQQDASLFSTYAEAEKHLLKLSWFYRKTHGAKVSIIKS